MTKNTVKGLSILLAVCMGAGAFGLAAKAEGESSDELFLNNLSTALASTFDSELNSDIPEEPAAYGAFLSAMLNGEKTLVGEDTTASFSSRKLRNYASDYLDALDSCIAEANTLASGKSTDTAAVDEAMAERKEILAEIYDIYGFDVDAEYITGLHDLYNNMYISDMGEKAFDSMLNAEDSGGWSITEGDDGQLVFLATLINDSGYEFQDLRVRCTVQLKGEDDVHISDVVIKDWQPDQVRYVTCYFDDIDYSQAKKSLSAFEVEAAKFESPAADNSGMTEDQRDLKEQIRRNEISDMEALQAAFYAAMFNYSYKGNAFPTSFNWGNVNYPDKVKWSVSGGVLTVTYNAEQLSDLSLKSSDYMTSK